MAAAVPMLIGAGISAASSAYQASEQREIARDSRREEKKLQEKQRAIRAGQAAKERRRQVAQARMEQARLQSAAQASGVAGSSAEAGAVSSTASQTGSNIFEINTSISNAETLLAGQNALNKKLQAQPSSGGAFLAGVANQYGQSLFETSVQKGTESLF